MVLPGHTLSGQHPLDLTEIGSNLAWLVLHGEHSMRHSEQIKTAKAPRPLRLPSAGLGPALAGYEAGWAGLFSGGLCP